MTCHFVFCRLLQVKKLREDIDESSALYRSTAERLNDLNRLEAELDAREPEVEKILSKMESMSATEREVSIVVGFLLVCFLPVLSWNRSLEASGVFNQHTHFVECLTSFVKASE